MGHTYGPPRKVDLATSGDWTFMEDHRLLEALRSAARAVAGAYGSCEDDLYQEAMLYTAVSPELVANKTVGQIYAQVRRKLEQGAKSDQDLATSADVGEVEDLRGSDDTSGMVPYVYDDFKDTAYPRLLVEQLLEAMWNGWVIVDEFRPDSDMPRAKPNPKTSGTAMAHKIDVERAWAMADLKPTERAALYLRHGQGMTEEAIGKLALNTYQQDVSRILERGIKAMLVELNGEPA